MPQQQRSASQLALPVQRGEETAGHVGLSYVLTCPSLPPLEILSSTRKTEIQTVCEAVTLAARH